MVPECLAGVVPEVLAAGVLGVSTITSVSNVCFSLTLAFFFFLFLKGVYCWVANDAVICSSSSASPVDDDSDSVADSFLCGVFCPSGKDSSPDDLFSSFSALFSVAVLVVFGLSGWVNSMSGWNSTVVDCSPNSTVGGGMGGSLNFTIPAGSREAYVGGELDFVFLSV